LAKALVVGICAGGIGALFRIVLRLAEDGRMAAYARMHGAGGLALAVAIGAAGAGAALWIVRRFAPETSGSGIPHLKSVVLGQAQLRWQRVLPLKFIAGLLGIGSGLALGREGPTIQIGGAAGLMVSNWFRVVPGEGERKALISAGAGAGLAAAFNAPLAGMIFVLEELHGAFTPVIFVAAFLASVTSDVVARFLAGPSPVFAVQGMVAPGMEALPAAAVAGVLAGFLGVGFNRSIIWSLDFYRRVQTWPAFWVGALTGVLGGIAGWLVPGLSGTGGYIVQQSLDGRIAPGLVPLLLIARFCLTILAFGCGAAGGIFLPLLVIGALGGFSFGAGVHVIAPVLIHRPEVFAVLGMGALFTAIVRAPLTGLVLMIELTGTYEFMLPLMVCCFAAYGVAEGLHDVPIYEALRLRRQRLGLDVASA
jgi:CIC family chloride channel protein